MGVEDASGSKENTQRAMKVIVFGIIELGDNVRIGSYLRDDDDKRQWTNRSLNSGLTRSTGIYSDKRASTPDA